MPVNERYPLRDVIEACRAFYARRRRRVFVEYVMLAGVNDRYEQALALADVLAPAGAAEPVMFKVNLIPYNPTGSAVRGLQLASRSRPFARRSSRAASPRPSASPAGATSTPPAASSPRGLADRGLQSARLPPARASPARSSRSRSSACSSGVGSQLGDVGQLLEVRSPNSFRNWVVVR